MIEGPIQTNNNGLVFYFDTKEPKSYVGEPTTNIWSVQAGTNINSFNGWGMPNGGTASITSAIVTNYGTWNGNTIWLVTVGSGTLVSYGSWRLCVDQPTAGSAYPSTRRVAAKIRMLTGSITNIGLHSGGGTGGYNASDFTSILEKNVPSDCIIKDGWVQMLSDASWSSTTVGHCVGIGLNNSGPYSFLVTEPMYYPNNRLVNFTPTSRSNTQGLLDLTGGSTIDLTNAGYNASSEITFNGSSNYITINKTAAQLGLTSGGQMTVETFVRLSSLSGYTHIVDGSGNRWHLAVENSGDGASAYFWNGSSYHSTSSPAITANTWVYIAGVQESSLLKIYINGVLATNGSLSSAASNLLQDCNVAIGYWQGNNSRYLNGQIGYVRIYNRALSASEILKNFNSQRSRYSV